MPGEDNALSRVMMILDIYTGCHIHPQWYIHIYNDRCRVFKMSTTSIVTHKCIKMKQKKLKCREIIIKEIRMFCF